jgi:glutathione peroxidase
LAAPVALALAALAAGAAWFGMPAPAMAQGHAGVAAAPNCPALLQHTFPRLQDEKPQALCQYAGKVLLVVNTASYCGFTPQYQGLEQLHARYAARGLVVLGFPSNDFNQETGSSQQIADLCFNTYGVKFPMFAKTNVRGSDAHPFFRALAREADRAPRWNFHKYLVNRQGKVVEDFSSLTAPTDAKLVAAVERALAAK